MRINGPAIVIGAVAAALFAAACAKSADRGSTSSPASPVVIELYQSQGCSSCPPALEVLRREASRPGVIALSFAVTYWDQLGWKDSFAQPAFTQRQWDYARANGRGNVATPQLIVNGRAFLNGGDQADVDAAIRRFASSREAASLTLDGGRLTIGGAPGANRAAVWLVSYDPRTIDVPIRAGENGGRTLPHRNIVRKLELLGRWSGARMSYALPPKPPGLARAVLLQAEAGGPILAARALG